MRSLQGGDFMVCPMTRERMNNRRDSDLISLVVNGREYTIGVSYTNDERILELFLDTMKCGSEMSDIVKDLAVVISVALQNHVLAEKMAHSVGRHPDGEPATIVGAALDFMIETEKGKNGDV